MLTVVCGEDNVASRNYFLSLKNECGRKNYEARNIIPAEIEEIRKWLADSPSLFLQRRVYFVENLNKKISRKGNPQLIKTLEELIKDKNLEIVDWEDSIPSRFLKFPKGAIIKEFRPSQNIFKLLDSCYPGNLIKFLNLLETLPSDVEDTFIFIMLVRHLKNLILVKNNTSPPKMQSWQVGRLKSQTKWWSMDKLLGFYDGCYRIDVSVKTSKNPYTIKRSLELMACYYL
jgi:DNA polymerase III delta subunit